MRLKYYTITLRQMRLNKAFVFTLIVIVSILVIIVYMYNKAEPIITTLCESSAKAIALQVTNEAVSESIGNATYDDLVELKQDSTGKIIAINANVMELNKLATNISSSVTDKLFAIEKRYVKVPLTSIFNMGLFSGFGPRLPLNIIPSGSVIAKFKSEFEQAGINQTRSRIYIEVKTNVRLIAPFYTSWQEYVNEVTVAETVIVGDTPSTYYSIDGIENLDKKDTLNMFK